MKVSIANLKSIKKLDFTIPTSPGVYILSATNGAGKTSLLNAISFLFDGNALKNAFQPGKNGYDDFAKTQITYTDDANVELTYKFTKANWAPTKKNVKHVVPGYCSKGVFVRIDQHRVTPKGDELKNTKRVPCPFAADVADILDNPDFNDLATITIKGRRRAFVCKDRTEKYFSSGELAVIQMVQKVHSAAANSLILIDEAEISLHPATQLNLIEHLRHSAKAKDSVVLVSTHSQTVIKSSNSHSIYFLEASATGVNVINPCYPSYALQAISPLDDYFSDRIFLFEDNEAILYFNELKSRKGHCIKKQMSHICIPIAGWKQLAIFLDNARKHLRRSPSQEFLAIFDRDVRLKDLQPLPCYQAIAGWFQHLQMTPEVTPIEWLTTDATALPAVNKAFSQKLNASLLPSLKSKLAGKTSADKKAVWRQFLNEYEKVTGAQAAEIKRQVYGIWIDQHVKDVDATIFFNKIF